MSTENRNLTIWGTSISPGLADGPAFVFEDIFEREYAESEIRMEQIPEERERIENAIANVLEDLRHAVARVEQDLGPAMADIFRAHTEMLNDKRLRHEMRQSVDDGHLTAECAVQRVFGQWERRFRAMKDEVYQKTGDDMVDLGRRLLRSLAGVHAHSLEQMPVGSILVARRLLPSDTTFFAQRAAAGIAVETGGPASHCSLLTRQLGIPGIAQVPRLLEYIKTGDRILLDGLRGTLTVAPNPETEQLFTKRAEEFRAQTTRARQDAHLPATTRDDVSIPVMANIGNRHDAMAARENGADGVGLFRIEILFLNRAMLPTEDDLKEEILDTIAPFEGMPVTVRLLDIGGDKQLPYLPPINEENPFLGRRGVRFLLEYPELLDVQLRTLVRIAEVHDLRLLIPMVTFPDDVVRVRHALERIGAEIGAASLPQLGAMVETPAAALCAEDFAAVSDFLNIGSNDLTQYTMAAGREDPAVYSYFRDDHPAIFRLLAMVGHQGNQLPVGICGELASNPAAVPRLLRAGMRMLSVPPPMVPLIKQAVRSARIHAPAP